MKLQYPQAESVMRSDLENVRRQLAGCFLQDLLETKPNQSRHAAAASISNASFFAPQIRKACVILENTDLKFDLSSMCRELKKQLSMEFDFRIVRAMMEDG